MRPHPMTTPLLQDHTHLTTPSCEVWVFLYYMLHVHMMLCSTQQLLPRSSIGYHLDVTKASNHLDWDSLGGLILVPITLFNCDHAFATDNPTGGWAGGQRCSATYSRLCWLSHWRTHSLSGVQEHCKLNKDNYKQSTDLILYFVSF